VIYFLHSRVIIFFYINAERVICAYRYRSLIDFRLTAPIGRYCKPSESLITAISYVLLNYGGRIFFSPYYSRRAEGNVINWRACTHYGRSERTFRAIVTSTVRYINRPRLVLRTRSPARSVFVIVAVLTDA